jgi:DNA-binding MarR family transcriptional regulator
MADDVREVPPQLSRSAEMPEYTERQGQYLAFIYYYTKLNGRPPAEADIGRYFRVTPPTVHQMILTLEKRGFISREPGRSRTICLLLSRDQLPDLT